MPARVRRLASFDELNDAYSEVYGNSANEARSPRVSTGGNNVVSTPTPNPTMTPITPATTIHEKLNIDLQSTAAFWNYGGKEVFVFDFGAIVFWGYHREEVTEILALIKSDFIDKTTGL
jgi:uncharacterized Rmd1/YagE family protein